MKKLLLSVCVLTTLLTSCVEYESEQDMKWVPVIVKSKYTEVNQTKDLAFGTGNWYDNDYYIIDENNKVWERVSKKDFIRAEKGDTMWTDNDFNLYYEIGKHSFPRPKMFKK